MGESTTRSQSPYDQELHTMEEVEVPNSSPVHGEPALGGVGAWSPPDVDEGMDLDPVTDMAVAGDDARSGVGGLSSGQVRLREGVGQDEAIDLAMDLGLDEAAEALSGAGGAGDQEVPAANDGGLSAADGASARPGAGHGVAAGRDLLGPAGQTDGGDGGVSRKAAANRSKRQRKAAEQRASQPTL